MGVESKIKIGLNQLKPVKFVNKIKLPAVFIGGSFD